MEFVGLLALALVAGAVSFSSPCVLPLLPGYVSYASRTAARAGDPRRARRGPALFVVGFGLVFIAMGLTASAVGLALRQNADVLTRAAGVVVVVLGLAMTGFVRVPVLGRECRPGLRRAASDDVGGFGLGVAFALGWTPCVGPVLATILAIAASSGELVTGGLFLAAYVLGLGVPFLLLARAIERGHDHFAWLRRHSRAIEVGGGVALALTGVLMISGIWSELMAGVLAGYARLGWPPV